MSKYHLGEFEEVVLLTVAILGEEAYGVVIAQEIEERLNRKVSVGSLQTSLRRLEKKGFVSSEFGAATSIRGGKRKRYFKLTPFGKRVLTEVKEQRMQLWNAIPEFVLSK